MFWDFRCTQCDTVVEHWSTHAARPAVLPCSQCAGRMKYDMSGYRGGIDQTNPRMGYGRYHLGFDTVVTSYGHKQQLLRETGMVESSDPTKGSRNYIPDEYSELNPIEGKVA